MEILISFTVGLLAGGAIVYVIHSPLKQRLEILERAIKGDE